MAHKQSAKRRQKWALSLEEARAVLRLARELYPCDRAIVAWPDGAGGWPVCPWQGSVWELRRANERLSQEGRTLLWGLPDGLLLVCDSEPTAADALSMASGPRR